MRAISLLLFFWAAVIGCRAESLTLEQQRQAFVDARELQRQQHWSEYEALRPVLDNYPLAVYLDYYAYLERLESLSPDALRTFAVRYPGVPLTGQLQRAYLHYLGNTARWQAFLHVQPSPPKEIVLQCYYYRARLAEGNRLAAWQGARQLWLHGRSQPEECDPLFAGWQQSADFGGKDVWHRMELAFAAGQGGLLTYLRKMLPDTMQADGKLMTEVFDKPEHLAQISLFSGHSSRLPEIIALAIPRLAQRDPEQAWALWQVYRTRRFSDSRIEQVESVLASRLFEVEPGEAARWRDRWLSSHGTPGLLDRRIRQALERRDWQALLIWIERYEQRQSLPERWIYWREQGRRQLEGTTAPAPAYLQLAAERSYYGFLAASELNGPYRMALARPEVDPSLLQQIAAMPAISRIDELLYQERLTQARAEWYRLIRDQSPQWLLAYAEFARQRQWHHYAILATIEGRMWDLLEHRFPIPWEQEMTRFAASRQLPRSLLYAVARQESALNPLARSHADARGLMQLMPGTAKQTARELGFGYRSSNELFQPEVNIRLGSAYLGSLLERYQGNRIMAIAAYNAGPHRVDRWLDETRPRSMAAWVETIPFRETRGYVKNVLAFNVIYQTLLGDPPQLLTALERRGSD